MIEHIKNHIYCIKAGLTNDDWDEGGGYIEEAVIRVLEEKNKIIEHLKEACEYALDGLTYNREDLRKNAIEQIQATLKLVKKPYKYKQLEMDNKMICEQCENSRLKGTHTCDKRSIDKNALLEKCLTLFVMISNDRANHEPNFTPSKWLIDDMIKQLEEAVDNG